MKNKIISIVGPTCSGKSNLAIKIAQKISGEIISVDSRQVYKKMNIGTAKVSGKLNTKKSIDITVKNKKIIVSPFVSEKINHWMIDVLNPKNELMTASLFCEMSSQIISNILIRKKIPILAGGTALYMDSVLNGYNFPKTDLNLRNKLESYSTEELLKQLYKFDKSSAEKNKDNHRRLVRALESYMVNKKPISLYEKEKPNFQYLILGIACDRKKLYQKIDNNVDNRIKKGMIEETKKLLRFGVSHEKLQNFGLEYRYIDSFLEGNISKSEMIQKLKYKIHAFVRRQLVWWRKNKKIIWVNNDINLFKKSINIINNFLYDSKN